MEKKKLLAIVAGAAAVAIVIALIVIFTIGGNSARLEQPTGLAVVETGGKKLVCVDTLEDATQYRFTITPKNETSGQVACLDTHQFDASSYLQKPGEYTISCQYVGKEEFNISPAQEITYLSKHQVALPTVNLNDNIVHVQLFDYFYEAVDLTVTLHFTIGKTAVSSTNFTIQNCDNRGILMGYFDLNNIFGATAGTYSLCVQITTNNVLYLPSDFTPQITHTFA
ncbi:MAG: hypothetical protein J6A98_00315 [Clostridia bacterium]|nr:hypothetical protein [Clostridia bacterium]